MQVLSDAQTKLLAAGILAAVALGLAAWTVRFHRRLDQTWAQIPLRWLNLVMVRVIWRTTYRGQLPETSQGAIIVCNHISPVDPAYIALASNQMVRWMVAREYCENWFLGPFLKALEVIPVGRGGVDTAATKSAIRSARAGRIIGMFPEGRINRTRESVMLPGRPGALLVAIKARVPIIPCFLTGAPYDGTTLGCFFMFGKGRLTIGQPIDLSEYFGREDDKQVLDMLTRRVLRAIAELAGTKNYVPEVAGRKWNSKEISTPEPEIVAVSDNAQ